MFSCACPCMCVLCMSFSDISMQVLCNSAEQFFSSSQGKMTNLLPAYTQPPVKTIWRSKKLKSQYLPKQKFQCGGEAKKPLVQALLYLFMLKNWFLNTNLYPNNNLILAFGIKISVTQEDLLCVWSAAAVMWTLIDVGALTKLGINWLILHRAEQPESHFCVKGVFRFM